MRPDNDAKCAGIRNAPRNNNTTSSGITATKKDPTSVPRIGASSCIKRPSSYASWGTGGTLAIDMTYLLYKKEERERKSCQQSSVKKQSVFEEKKEEKELQCKMQRLFYNNAADLRRHKVRICTTHQTNAASTKINLDHIGSTRVFSSTDKPHETHTHIYSITDTDEKMKFVSEHTGASVPPRTFSLVTCATCGYTTFL